MIRLAPNPTFTKEVPISLPGVETPAIAIFTFRAVEPERGLSMVRMQTGNWFVRLREWLRLSIQMRKPVNGLDLLDMMIVSWDEGDSGFDLPYSKESLLLLLIKDPHAAARIPLAYFAGLQEERLKN
jgi:hypothetical protein